MSVFDYKGNESYTGCVITRWEHNGYDDSDFYCKVWDEETQSVKTIEYATTRGYRGKADAKIDATPEVIEKAISYYLKQARKNLTQCFVSLGDEIKAKTFIRNSPIQQGTVTWLGKSKYPPYQTRVCFQSNGKRAFANAWDVTLKDFKEPTEDSLRSEAKRLVYEYSYR